MRKNILLAGALLLLLPATVNAGPASMMGMGFNPCSEMVRVSVEDPEVLFEYFQWISGYMSGLNSSNIVERKRFKDLDGLVAEGKAGRVMVPILRACHANPGLLVANVVENFYRQLPSRNWPN